MRTVFGLQIAIFTLFVVSWALNLNKLMNCDFEPNYKCEFVHGVGLVPMAAPFTVWFATDGDAQ